MSPISTPEPCPHIIEIDSFVFCAIYADRPDECRDHILPFKVCPIGASMLEINSTDELRKRIDDGHYLIYKLGSD